MFDVPKYLVIRQYQEDFCVMYKILHHFLSQRKLDDFYFKEVWVWLSLVILQI